MSPTPVTFAAEVAVAKVDVFDLCDAFASCEVMYRRLGMAAEADRLRALFEDLEARLSEPYASVSGSALPPSLS